MRSMWKLDQSWQTARNILESLARMRSQDWDHFVSQHRSAKHRLAEAIAPGKDTARREFPLGEHLTPASKQQAFQLAGCNQNLNSITAYFPAADVDRWMIHEDSPVLERWPGAKLKKGQKLSRALAAILIHECGMGKDAAALKVSAIKSDYQSRLRNVLVVSCNPLDLLLCSVECSYNSCHDLRNGAHKAGPLIYLQDEFTAVLYIAGATRKWTLPSGLVVETPLKIWRQIVHFSRKKTCARMRQYGEFQMPREQTLQVSALLAPILARFCGKDDWAGWDHLASQDVCSSPVEPENGGKYAYVDHFHDHRGSLVTLPGWKLTSLEIDQLPNCPRCAQTRHFPSCEYLLCRTCETDSRCRLCSISEFDAPEPLEMLGAEAFCRTCLETRFTNCEHCACKIAKTHIFAVHSQDSLRQFCYSCRATHARRCTSCASWWRREELTSTEDYHECPPCHKRRMDSARHDYEHAPAGAFVAL